MKPPALSSQGAAGFSLRDPSPGTAFSPCVDSRRLKPAAPYRWQRPRTRRFGLTLTEILVVIGIIVLVLGLAVPALSVWESRKVEQAINLTQALIQRVRIKAETDTERLGLFFYVEPRTQTQYMWSIDRAPDKDNPSQTADRYILRDAEPFMLPKPMRVTPASVLDLDLDEHLEWVPEQLADDLLRDAASSEFSTPWPPPNLLAPQEPVGTQYHRNHFVILFDKRGKIDPTGRAYIVDQDPTGGGYPGSAVPLSPCGVGVEGYAGSRTGLYVSDATDPIEGLRNAVVDDDCNPISFQSADAVMIYNDEAFRALPKVDSLDNDQHRRYLRQASQPLYIHRVTGKIIKGEPEGA